MNNKLNPKRIWNLEQNPFQIPIEQTQPNSGNPRKWYEPAKTTTRILEKAKTLATEERIGGVLHSQEGGGICRKKRWILAGREERIRDEEAIAPPEIE
jgi:hypothetical protein